jgi:hypothetical protein
VPAGDHSLKVPGGAPANDAAKAAYMAAVCTFISCVTSNGGSQTSSRNEASGACKDPHEASADALCTKPSRRRKASRNGEDDRKKQKVTKGPAARASKSKKHL